MGPSGRATEASVQQQGQQQALRGTVVATGAVEPIRQVNLSPSQPGIVAAINVEEGEQVRTGQVLAMMDGGDLSIRIKERHALPTQAEEELAMREEELMRQQGLAAAGALAPLALSQLERRCRAQQSQGAAQGSPSGAGISWAGFGSWMAGFRHSPGDPGSCWNAIRS